MSRSSTRSLELQLARSARAVLQRAHVPARGARQVLGVLGDRDRDRREAFALEAIAPFRANKLTECMKIVLLDQEVRARASAFSRAGRAAD